MLPSSLIPTDFRGVTQLLLRYHCGGACGGSCCWWGADGLGKPAGRAGPGREGFSSERPTTLSVLLPSSALDNSFFRVPWTLCPGRAT